MRALLTIAGLAHVWFGYRALRRSHTAQEVMHSLCIALIGIAGLLWPAGNAIAVDRMVHVVGAGLLLRYIALTLGLVSGFASLAGLIEPRLRWHRAALGTYAGLVVLLIIIWGIARDTVGHQAYQSLYAGYDGTTWPLLAWNVAVGLTIAYSCTLLLLEITRVPHAAQDRQARVAMWIIFCILCGAGLGGSGAIAAQAVASRLGHGSGSIVGPLNVLVACAVTTSPVLNTWSFYLLPAWRTGRRILRLRYQIWTLRRLQRDLLTLVLLLNDRLAYHLEHAVPIVVDRVAVRCAERRLPIYQHRVAVGAACWITFRRAVTGRQSWYTMDAVARTAVDKRIAMDAARRARSGPRLYTDLHLVVILALGIHHVPQWLEVERVPQRWHLLLAILIGEAFGESKAAQGTWPLSAHDGRPGSITDRKRSMRLAVRQWTHMPAVAWRSVWGWWSVTAASEDYTEVSDNLTVLRAVCDDMLVYLRDKISPALICSVDALCQERRATPYESHVAREVVQWLGFFWIGIEREPPGEAICAHTREAAPREPDDDQRDMQRIRLLADCCRIILPMLRREHIRAGNELPRVAFGRRRRIAHLVRLTLVSEIAMRQEIPR